MNVVDYNTSARGPTFLKLIGFCWSFVKVVIVDSSIYGYVEASEWMDSMIDELLCVKSQILYDVYKSNNDSIVGIITTEKFKCYFSNILAIS